jgi:ParB-like chromosome segregation protein Spo0J
VHDATTDPCQIKNWWGKWPYANIGIATGKESDIIIVDIDPRHDGTKTLKMLEAKLGHLPKTVTSHTGGGGEHKIFKYPPFDVKSDTAGKVFGPGVDLVSDGSFVVAPKSRHASGEHYLWFKDLSPLSTEPVALPPKWVEHLKASTALADVPTATPGPIRPIALDEIRSDECVQARAKIVPKVVDEYTEAMLKGDEFPPLVVFQEGDTSILADGFTRLAAAKRIGRASINCEVRAGGLRDAMLFAAGANATHGRPRSTADKRCAVLKLLNDDEWGIWSDREIARHCYVGHQLVAELREVTGRATSERKFRSKHGSVGKMKVDKIGQKSRDKSSSAASSGAKETQQSALQSTADTNETQTTPGTPTSAPAASPNIRTKPDGGGLEIPEFLDQRDPAERTFAGLKAEWQNAAAFRHACAAAPVAVRDKFYAEVMQDYRE